LLRCQPRVNTYSHSSPQMKLSVPSYLLAAALLLSQGEVLATELRGAVQRELSVCQNSNTNWLALPADSGCSSAMPVCVKGDGSEVTVWNGFGDACAVCVNDKSGDSSWNPDKGCKDGPPGTLAFCVLAGGGEPGAGKTGARCAAQIGPAPPAPPTPACTNTNTDWLALPADNGCSDATPVCVKGDGSEVTEWNAGGNSCVACVNDKSGDSSWNPDKGCKDGPPGTLAFCVLANGGEPGAGKTGARCAAQNGPLPPPPLTLACKNTGWDGIDSGCSSGKPHCADGNGSEVTAWNGVGASCMKCIDDESTNQGWWRDKGCTGASPHCVDSNGNSPGKNKGGISCSTKPKA
jgi:hypothetical protein